MPQGESHEMEAACELFGPLAGHMARRLWREKRQLPLPCSVLPAGSGPAADAAPLSGNGTSHDGIENDENGDGDGGGTESEEDDEACGLKRAYWSGTADACVNPTAWPAERPYWDSDGSSGSGLYQPFNDLWHFLDLPSFEPYFEAEEGNMVEALVRRDKTPWRLMLQLLGAVATALAALHDADALDLQARMTHSWSMWLRLSCVLP